MCAVLGRPAAPPQNKPTWDTELGKAQMEASPGEIPGQRAQTHADGDAFLAPGQRLKPDGTPYFPLVRDGDDLGQKIRQRIVGQQQPHHDKDRDGESGLVLTARFRISN